MTTTSRSHGSLWGDRKIKRHARQGIPALALILTSACGIFSSECNIGFSLEVKPPSESLAVGEAFEPESARLVRDCDSRDVALADLEWTSEDESVVAIDPESGQPIAVSSGSTMVRAEYEFELARYASDVHLEVR